MQVLCHASVPASDEPDLMLGMQRRLCGLSACYEWCDELQFMLGRLVLAVVCDRVRQVPFWVLLLVAWICVGDCVSCWLSFVIGSINEVFCMQRWQMAESHWADCVHRLPSWILPTERQLIDSLSYVCSGPVSIVQICNVMCCLWVG